jgi:hypothetical protein
VEGKWLRIFSDIRWKKWGLGYFPILGGGEWLRISFDIKWRESGSGYFPILGRRKVAQVIFRY